MSVKIYFTILPHKVSKQKVFVLKAILVHNCPVQRSVMMVMALVIVVAGL